MSKIYTKEEWRTRWMKLAHNVGQMRGTIKENKLNLQAEEIKNLDQRFDDITNQILEMIDLYK